METIHMHSSEAGCCKAKGPRRFSMSTWEVNCKNCLASVAYKLSPDGEAYLKSLDK